MSKNKEILVISFKYPPMGGIGTRRWAKFSKYLAKRDYKVHVITIDYDQEDTINWSHDIKHKNIVVHRLKSGYPIFLLKYNNIFIKVFRKLINKYLYPIDIAQKWHKYFYFYTKKLIKKRNIKNIIVTNPPPSVAYQATYLKIELPWINLIQDYRDSWNDDIDFLYPETLKVFKLKEKVSYMEWFVINHSDYIVNVTPDITSRMLNKYKIFSDKFITITNGFDKDDIKNIKIESNTLNLNKEDKIRIVYIGSLSNGRDKGLLLLLEAIYELGESYIDKFKIDVYSGHSSILKNKFNKYKNIIDFLPTVSPKEIYKVISNYKYTLAINSEIYGHAYGTKIFDYMLLKKNIILISPEGSLSKLLKEKGQMVINYNKEDAKNKLKLLADGLYKFNQNISFDEFDIEYLTDKLEALFK